MNVITNFISNQRRILQAEQEYCQEKLRAQREDKRESCFGKIISKYVPLYGGTIVTFEIIRVDQNKEPNFKLGNIVEVRKGLNLKTGSSS